MSKFVYFSTEILTEFLIGKKTCQIDAKNIKNLHCQRKIFKYLTCQCKKYKEFALPMQIGGKKLVKSMKKKLALPMQKI